MVTAAGLAVALLATGAHAAPGAAETFEIDGTVGGHAVGGMLTLADPHTFASGHYFYASKLANIPLTGTVAGSDLTLAEPGGGNFALHLISSVSNGGAPLDFDSSTGLAGTWTKGAVTLPVKLGFDTVYPGGPPSPMYADVTRESDGAYEARVGRFLKAVLAGDKAAAAAGVSYPLSVNATRTLTIKTPAALIAHWSTIFTPALMAQIKAAVPHEMFVHENAAMVSGGAVWFDAKGATAINEP
jgi:hypothetical protein